MEQYFYIYYYGHLDSDPYKAFVWHEDDDGYEKYGFLFSSSISGCLTQIEKEIYEDDFEINIEVADKHGGKAIVTTLKELEEAKIKYSSITK